MDREFPVIDWRKSVSFFEQKTNFSIRNIYVQNKDYLKQLSALLQQHSSRAVDNYLCWSFVARFLPYSSPEMRHFYEEFRREVPEPSAGEGSQESSHSFMSHWKECVHLTCEGLKIPAALTYLSVRKPHLDVLTGLVTEMIGNLKSAFHRIIDKQTWLKDQVTKDLLKERIDSIQSRIGFPNFISDTEAIEKMYETLNVDQEDVFLANVMRITRHEMTYDLMKLNETVDEDKEWLMQPLVSNAYYDASSDNMSMYAFSPEETIHRLILYSSASRYPAAPLHYGTSAKVRNGYEPEVY